MLNSVLDLLHLILALVSQLLAIQGCLGEPVCQEKGGRYFCLSCVAGEEAREEHKSQGVHSSQIL